MSDVDEGEHLITIIPKEKSPLRARFASISDHDRQVGLAISEIFCLRDDTFRCIA